MTSHYLNYIECASVSDIWRFDYKTVDHPVFYIGDEHVLHPFENSNKLPPGWIGVWWRLRSVVLDSRFGYILCTFRHHFCNNIWGASWEIFRSCLWSIWIWDLFWDHLFSHRWSFLWNHLRNILRSHIWDVLQMYAWSIHWRNIWRLIELIETLRRRSERCQALARSRDVQAITFGDGRDWVFLRCRRTKINRRRGEIKEPLFRDRLIVVLHLWRKSE